MTAMLDSWNDGPTKSAITDFVGRITAGGRTRLVEPAARVAVFDNDGTLCGPRNRWSFNWTSQSGACVSSRRTTQTAHPAAVPGRVRK